MRWVVWDLTDGYIIYEGSNEKEVDRICNAMRLCGHVTKVEYVE